LLTRLKGSYILVAMLLLIPLLMPFGQTANAYGVINQENVVDIGKNHFVVLKDDGSVWSWGEHTYGQLGAQPSGSSSNPVPIQKADGNRLLAIKAIAAGGYHTVALDRDGKVWTWGRNSEGQLGHSSGALSNKKPEGIAGLPKIVAIAAGEYHTLAVDESGQVWAWGLNQYGQLGSSVGTGTPSISVIPSLVPNLAEVVAVKAGANHSVALKRDGTVWTWGRNTVGQLGNGETTDVNYTAKMVPGLTNIMEIAAGDNHTLALKQDRTTVWAWGSNSYGQLGDGGRENKLRPIQVQDIRNVNTISAGDNHTVAIKEDGTVWAWGRNASGTASNRTTPIQIKQLLNATAIGGGGGFGESFILAVKQDGTVWIWDKTSSDSTTQLPVFKKVSGIDDVMKNNEFPFIQGGQVLFHYIGNSNVTDVKVFGSFNNWIEIPLEKQGNVWELQADIGAGEYEYGFKVNGEWVVDPLNRNKTIDEFGRPLSILKVAPYATETPIIDNKEVTFTYSSYDFNGMLELNARTSSVSVIGSFSNWVEIPLIKQPNNTWALTKTIEPGDYYYSFVVRDNTSGAVAEKRNDPLNSNLQTDSLTGISRNTFHVSEKVLTKVPVTNVTLNKGPALDLIVGEQDFLLATVSPSNATNKNVNWTSSNPSVVSVEAGKMTAHSKGTAVIMVTTVDGGKVAMVTVTVHQQDNAVSYPRIGYEMFDDKTGVSQTKVWRIKFNDELNLNSVNRDNVYVLNESGVKVPLGYQLVADGKTLEIRLQDGFKYAPGATYYLFIEDTVRTKYGASLSEKYQMKFQVQL
jgi:alpha-tubulin suppressor-like RCC1 family protein/uncharacterized protein YjdB